MKISGASQLSGSPGYARDPWIYQNQVHVKGATTEAMRDIADLAMRELAKERARIPK